MVSHPNVYNVLEFGLHREITTEEASVLAKWVQKLSQEEAHSTSTMEQAGEEMPGRQQEKTAEEVW